MSEPDESRREADERIRFCLGCGEPVPFEQATCSACGHTEGLPEVAEEDLTSCGACSGRLAASLVFCPSCGASQVSLDPGEPVDAALLETPRDPVQTVSVVLAVLAPLLAAAALAAAYAYAPAS